jgi:hypothetical protein
MGTEDRLTEVAVKIDAEWAARVQRRYEQATETLGALQVAMAETTKVMEELGELIVRFDFSDLELEDDEEL